MLAFALIVALTAHSALAKPTGNCIFMCEAQPGGASGAYTQPGGFGGSSGAYTQPGGFGGAGAAFPQPGGFGGAAFPQPGGFGGAARPVYPQQPSYGVSNFGGFPSRGARLEDFSSVPAFAQPARTEVVQQQIPIQPEINGLFTHQSSKSSYEANNGFLHIRQPGMTQTVISEPIRQPPRLTRPPGRVACEYVDPCY